MKALWFQMNYYLGLIFFALGSTLYNLVASLCFWVPATPEVQLTFRKWISRLLNAYIFLLRATGGLRYSPPDFSKLPTGTGLIFIANHPSILDAPLLLSQSPRFICFFKSALKKKPVWQSRSTLGWLCIQR
ncbi:MAG: hypothetical protein LR015_02670 [Verrucomicrobia bacterium]|nr:hypothetical protein [Verrucomicrobiota bacterium]